MTQQQVHIVPHMHWDREWYFSTEESRILLMNNMEEILTRLEEDAEYPYYVLDGQTVVLEDYLTIKPEAKERVKALVRAGKLIIGPWYTQTDEMVVSGESIVRNLLYGHKDAKEFGEPMKIGYLPDSFGQSEQMPHMLNGFNIERAMFWRGMTEHNGSWESEFEWKSPDGSRTKTVLLPDGYAIGKYLPADEEALKEKMDKNFKLLNERATTDHVLIPNGHDQMPIQQNIHEIIASLEKIYPDKDFFLSRFEDLFEKIEEEKTSFKEVQGEFLQGKYMRVHKSIYSTRMDIKTLNTQLEYKIVNELEPLMALAYRLGFDYHGGLLEKIWKEMMKNHAHDSIGCCCSDKVHREIKERFLMTEERVNRLIEFYMRKIVDSMLNEPHQDKLTAFNLFPQERKTAFETKVITKEKQFRLVDENGEEPVFRVRDAKEKDPGLIDRQIVHYGDYDPFIEYTIVVEDVLPAMGYKTYLVKKAEGTSEVAAPQEVDALENDFYKVVCRKNGTLDVYDKELDQWFERVLTVENGGDDGDEYDYSPPREDWVLTNELVEASVSVTEEKAEISYSLDIPSDLDARERREKDSSIDIHWRISLPRYEKRIDVEGEVRNTSEDHRLRVLIPAGFSNAVSIADQPFGTIERPTNDPVKEVWEEEQWSERPDEINPMLSFVSLAEEKRGLSVLTNSTREYEIVGEDRDTIALTLLRSVGILGKADLVRRPGRPSGIALPTPDSQMKGTWEFAFAVTSHSGHPVEEHIPRKAKKYLTPILTYNKIEHDAMKLNPSNVKTPYHYSFFKQEDEDTVLSTVKKEEEGDGIIIRSFNPSWNHQAISRFSSGDWDSFHETNLDERKSAKWQRKNVLEAEVQPCSTQSWCVKPSKR
ncbi:mannosylglycerate hydrolase [Alteribacillus sp. JSM 102045]|uniref:mannosylglycerate hydrolase n=1 Tax=Alteribacillus sp. JSM 102045 TaxID=1562101 RepID=UPI0035C1437D